MIDKLSALFDDRLSMLHRPDSVSKREEKPGALKVLIDLLFAIVIAIDIAMDIDIHSQAHLV